MTGTSGIQESLARVVCLFLAEMLRTREVSLKRGAEIAERIVVKLSEVETEQHFLEIIKRLEYDFQELRHLHRDLIFYHEVSDREMMEKLVREFAIQQLPNEPQRAVGLMEQALKPEISLRDLTNDHPGFAEFVEEKNEH